MREQRSWTDTELDYLRANYANVPVKEVMHQLGRSRPSIQGMAAILGLKSKRTVATDAICHTYFSNVNTNEQAYILGLLAADGYVDPAGQVRLYLHTQDAELVEWVRDRIAPRSPLHQHASGNAIGLRITSQQLTADLAQYGIIQRKSYTFEYPKALPAQFNRPFLLGYFDGDGSLYYEKRGTWKPYLHWSLYGQSAFLRDAAQIINQETGVMVKGPRQPRQNRSLFVIQASGINAQKIDAWLNQDGMGLPRKHL